MTKQNVMTIKLATLSTLGIALTFFLGNYAMNNITTILGYGSQLLAVPIGIFSGIGVIATIVYFLVEEESN
jgi:Mg2+ and Co2+ transporter CorA